MDFAPEKVDNQVLLDYGVLDATMPRVGGARQCYNVNSLVHWRDQSFE